MTLTSPPADDRRQSLSGRPPRRADDGAQHFQPPSGIHRENHTEMVQRKQRQNHIIGRGSGAGGVGREEGEGERWGRKGGRVGGEMAVVEVEHPIHVVVKSVAVIGPLHFSSTLNIQGYIGIIILSFDCYHMIAVLLC